MKKWDNREKEMDKGMEAELKFLIELSKILKEIEAKIIAKRKQ